MKMTPLARSTFVLWAALCASLSPPISAKPLEPTMTTTATEAQATDTPTETTTITRTASTSTTTTTTGPPPVEPARLRTLTTTTTIRIEERKEIGIYMNVADFVLTDREFEQVLERLRREAEAMNLTLPQDPAPTFFSLDGIGEERRSRTVDEKTRDGDEVASPDCSCPICLDQLELGLLLKCGHVFHIDCLNEWKVRRADARCPICCDVMEPRARIRYQVDVDVNLESSEPRKLDETPRARLES